MITFADIAETTKGNVLQMPHPEAPIRNLLTDSRRGIFNVESLFFAVTGVRHDGHQFIESLYGKGVRHFVVEYMPKGNFPEANMVIVPDSVKALQQVAARRRRCFSIPVIGITGSNGKTIVKEWLAQLLNPYQYVVKNPKSYNSQIGVPLSVWLMQAEHEIGIFEAGISQPSEMEKLVEIIQPTIGIFTNIGPAHDEGFQDREQKVIEKALLFQYSQTIIYCRDYPEIDRILQEKYIEKDLYTWSTKHNLPADLVLIESKHNINGTQIALVDHRNKLHFSLQIPFQDEASLENTMHCIAYMLFAGYDVASIQKGLSGLRKVSMRMELKQGINHCYLLDDSYSNDLLGLQMALDFLQQQKQNEKQTVILSDLLQTGQSEEALYEEVRRVLIDKGVQKLIIIGDHIRRYQSVFTKDSKLLVSSYINTDAFLQGADFSSFRYENILIKGARKFGFEYIVKRLQQKIHSTTLEINLDALTHNLNFYRSQLQAGTKVMVMVKAFSYGGAAFEIANLLQFHQIDYLAVAYADEGIMLRENGVRTPILVLNPSPDSFEKMASYHLEPEIYSLRMLHLFLEESSHWSEVPPVHLKIDTGMHRLGFENRELDDLLQVLIVHPNLRIASIFSHLAASDEPIHDAFTRQQVELYLSACHRITEVLGYTPLRHILNSAGITRFPEYHLDMVRLGIGLYGVDPNHQQALRPISRLKTVISQIKHIKKGDTIGYSRRGVVQQTMKIATIAIGYADGFDRGFSNGNAFVFVKGQSAPTIGSICMDMCMIDITHIEAEEGEEVVIFGEEQSVQTLAVQIGTIPYEILTSISERVKRVFYTDS